MPAIRYVLATLMLLGIVLVPVYYKIERDRNYRNIRVVDDGVLYRSGQMTPEGFQRTVREFGIRTVISLRDSKDEGKVSADQAEVEYCREQGITHFRFAQARWQLPDGSHPVATNMTEFLRILSDPEMKKPVLVHCFAGIHRTGGYVAVYRMEYDGWSAAEAIEEMRSMGTPRTTFEDDVMTYLTTYEPRKRGTPTTGSNKPANR